MISRPFRKRIFLQATKALAYVIVGIWIFSLFVGIRYTQYPSGYSYIFVLADGRLGALRMLFAPKAAPMMIAHGFSGWHFFKIDEDCRTNGLQGAYFDIELKRKFILHSFDIPLWALLVADLMAMGILSKRLNARRSKNICQSCTYDLTNNTSGICPECGESIPYEQRNELIAIETG